MIVGRVALALRLGAAVLAVVTGCSVEPEDTQVATQQGGEDPVFDALDAFIAQQSIDKSNPSWKLALPQPPKQTMEPGKSYLWELETSQGPIVIKLMPDVAPMHATSTIYLARLGFYDDTVFHRVIPGFMAQGGDPQGNGTGGPGYTYDGEFDANVKHDRRGLLSMANRGPGTDGSQFFITFAPAPWLDGRHTIFGEVVSGMETLGELEKYGSQQGRTTAKLELRKASVRVE